MARNGGDVWFEYAITRGRLTAMPVSAFGWLALIGTTIVPVGACLMIVWFMALNPLLLVPLVTAAMAVSLITLFTLVKRKGRRVSP